MIHYLTNLTGQFKGIYIGIKIKEGLMAKYNEELKEILGDDFELFVGNREKRDGVGDYHITVINTSTYNKLFKQHGSAFVNNLENEIFNYEIDDLKMLGIGKSELNNNTTYYVVCKSDKIQAIRTHFGLDEIHPHITLGFDPVDIMGVDKDKIMDRKSSFIKLLSHSFYKDNNWDFIKSIKNFDLDKDKELIPVHITNTYMKFKCDLYFIDVVKIDDSLSIGTKYIIDNDVKRLPETEIKKYLKQ